MATPASFQIPQALQSYRRRYGRLLPQYGQGVLAPIMQADYNRAIRGAMPIPETLSMAGGLYEESRLEEILKALETGKTSYEKKPKGGPLGLIERIGQDIGLFARSLPQLPGAVIEEAKALPNFATELAQIRAEPGSDPLDIFKAPGLRLLPGAYVASEGAHVFSEHPLFAAADVLPFAKPVARAGGPAALAAARGAAPRLTENVVERVMRPIEHMRLSGETARKMQVQQRALARETAHGIEDIDLPTLQRSVSDMLVEAYGKPQSQVAGKRGRIEWEQWDEQSNLADPIWMPKAVKDTFRQTFHRKPRYAAQKHYEKAMGAYRTAILPLSPRWHLYNVIGGALLTGARGGPGMLRHVQAAWKMARNPETMPVELSRGWAVSDAADKAAQVAAGGTLGRITKAVSPAWNAAETIDSFYRSLAFLHHTDKNLTKGMPRAEAREVGIREANKVLQDWDAMRPFERQVLRTIFPFYGWMKHILKYTATYPIDHPLRASILGAFARNEIEDWKTGLPNDFQNYFMFGETDDQGNQKGLNLRGANPFSDVGSMFTFAGFLSQFNPFITTMLEAVGVNTMSGRADLYPDVDYDENTGRLVTKQPTPAEAALEFPFEFIPQLKAAKQLLGFTNTDERQMQLSNPEAYRQMVWSELGVPMPRTINQPLEIAQSEFRRSTEMQNALTTAIKTGNYSEAMRYPKLRPLIAYLQQQQLDQIAIQPKPSGIDLGAITQMLNA